jgi:hypothetical protein
MREPTQCWITYVIADIPQSGNKEAVDCVLRRTSMQTGRLRLVDLSARLCRGARTLRHGSEFRITTPHPRQRRVTPLPIASTDNDEKDDKTVDS